MATQLVSTMYRDLLSTKGRKYSQRQRKLKWCGRKAYITVQHRRLATVTTSLMVHINNHMKPSRVFLYTTDSTEKPQGPESLPLIAWISPIISSANTKCLALCCMLGYLPTTLSSKEEGSMGRCCLLHSNTDCCGFSAVSPRLKVTPHPALWRPGPSKRRFLRSSWQ